MVEFFLCVFESLYNIVHCDSTGLISCCQCGNDYVGSTSQRFAVKREQHDTKKLKNIYSKWRRKVEQPSIHGIHTWIQGEQSSIKEHLLNRPSFAENWIDSRFKILSRAKNVYYLSIKSLFMKLAIRKFLNICQGHTIAL